MMRPAKKTLIQFLQFGLVGLSNTVISLLVYYIFIWIDREMYLAGNIAGWIIGVSNSFFWNNRFVFKNESTGFMNNLRKFMKAYASYGITFLLTTALLYLEIDILEISVVFSPIFNLLITIPFNFVLNKFWTFR